MRIMRIAVQAWKQNLRDPVMWLGLALFILGQELGWRFGQHSIEAEFSVSLSLVYSAMHLVGGVIAIAVGCRVWQRNRFDLSFELEQISPSGPTKAFIGRVIGLMITVVTFDALCMAAAWQPTIGPVREMRGAFVALGMEQLILASVATFFAALTSPLLAAVLTGLFWLVGLIAPFTVGYLIHQYSPARDFLISAAQLMSLQRLQVIDPYALGEGTTAAVDWTVLAGYTTSAVGFFLALSYLAVLRQKSLRG